MVGPTPALPAISMIRRAPFSVFPAHRHRQGIQTETDVVVGLR